MKLTDISTIKSLMAEFGTVFKKKYGQNFLISERVLSEIADNAGITRQGVRDSIKRAECILLDLEAKIGWAGRYRELGAALQKIEAQTRLIQSYHEQGKILGTGVYDATVEILSTLKSIEQ